MAQAEKAGVFRDHVSTDPFLPHIGHDDETLGNLLSDFDSTFPSSSSFPLPSPNNHPPSRSQHVTDSALEDNATASTNTAAQQSLQRMYAAIHQPVSPYPRLPHHRSQSHPHGENINTPHHHSKRKCGHHSTVPTSFPTPHLPNSHMSTDSSLDSSLDSLMQWVDSGREDALVPWTQSLFDTTPPLATDRSSTCAQETGVSTVESPPRFTYMTSTARASESMRVLEIGAMTVVRPHLLPHTSGYRRESSASLTKDSEGDGVAIVDSVKRESLDFGKPERIFGVLNDMEHNLRSGLAYCSKGLKTCGQIRRALEKQERRNEGDGEAGNALSTQGPCKNSVCQGSSPTLDHSVVPPGELFDEALDMTTTDVGMFDTTAAD